MASNTVAHFDSAPLSRQRAATHLHRQGVVAYVRSGSAAAALTSPIIYSLLVPFIVLDAWVTVYQWACFPVYGIPRVSRADYLIVDRQMLPYLNGLEKMNCVFCAYTNGLIAYVREVAARTEEYWCPIKHARKVRTPHTRYDRFFEFGDAAGYRRGLMALRREMRREHPKAHR